MASLGSLVVSLAMDTAKFTNDVGKAARSMDMLAKEAGKIGAALGASVTAGVTALGYMVKASIDAADASSKLAQSVGVTTEELSALTYAADLSGVSQDDLAASLAKLARHAAEAAAGGKSAAAVYEAMGIAITDGNGNLRSTTELLGDVAEKFASYENGAAKTALAQDLFGKSGAKLIPFLNSGRAGLEEMADEASKLGLILTTESGVAAEKFNDSLTRLAKVQTGFVNNLTQAMLPALEFVSNDLNNAALRTNGFKDATVDLVQLLSKLLVPLEAVAVLAVNVGYVFKQTGNEIGGMAAQIAALGRMDIRGFRAIGDMMKEDAAAARKEVDQLSDYILNFSKRLNQSVSAPQAAYSNEGRNYQRLGERISAPLIKAANAASEATGKIKKSIGSIDPQSALQNLSKAPSDREFLNLVNDLGDGMQKLLTLDDADFVRRFGNIQDMIAKTPTAQLERARQDMLALADAYQQGLFGIVGSTEAVDAYAEIVRTRLGIDVPKVVQQSFEEISEFAKQAERNIQDALGDTLKKTLSGDFKSIGQLWKNLLINMAAEAIAADIGRKLFPKGIGSGSFFSSILSFLGFAKGGAFSGGQVMPFASGGVISSPTMFPMRGGMGLMGEAGPEAIMPLRRGPDGRLGVEGGGSTTNVTYNVAAGVSRNEMITALQVMQQSIESRMIGIMRRQGVA
jgi:ribosomal protein L12E/L44/L45/RPP1/RPP2